MLMQGVWLMLYGLGGVFASLAMLYIITKILIRIFPEKEEEKKEV